MQFISGRLVGGQWHVNDGDDEAIFGEDELDENREDNETQHDEDDEIA